MIMKSEEEIKKEIRGLREAIRDLKEMGSVQWLEKARGSVEALEWVLADEE